MPSAELPDEGLAVEPGAPLPAGDGSTAPAPISKKQRKRLIDQAPRHPDLMRMVDYIVDILGEKDDMARGQIFRTLLYCGIEFGLDMLDKAIAVQADGGLMVQDGSRPRTFGGTYFVIARDEMTFEQRGWVYHFPNHARKEKEKQSVINLELWNNRLPLLEGLQEERGVAKTVKVTIIGRPGKIEVRPDVVITTMEYAARNIVLPKGVPPIPETPTVYTIYISAKQWRKVEERIADPNDMLIIEGITAFDPESGTMSIHATGVTTKGAEAHKREFQRANRQPNAVEQEGAGAPADAPQTDAPQAEARPVPVEKPKKPKAEPAAKPSEAAAKTGAFSSLPPHIAQKLNELYSSAAVFRQKLAAIQAKPAGQQFGLEMTQKLLKNVEDEIANLEKQYAK